MTTTLMYSEKELLELYRIGLENIVKMPEACAALARFGYDADKLEAGRQIYDTTCKAFEGDLRCDRAASQTAMTYYALIEDLNANFLLHRKKAKIVFYNNEDAIRLLSLDALIPNAFSLWIDTITDFYTGLKSDPSLLDAMVRFEIYEEELDAILDQILFLEKLRIQYLKEIGESEETAKAKDISFAMLDQWMSEFNATTQFVFAGNPELLETICKNTIMA